METRGNDEMPLKIIWKARKSRDEISGFIIRRTLRERQDKQERRWRQVLMREFPNNRHLHCLGTLKLVHGLVLIRLLVSTIPQC